MIGQILKYAQNPVITNMHGVALTTGPLIAEFIQWGLPDTPMIGQILKYAQGPVITNMHGVGPGHGTVDC